MNELHYAAGNGSTERTLAALSRGVIKVDEGTCPEGITPLMFAAGSGHSRCVRILLKKGASAAMADISGATAMHVAAQEGHIAVAKLLVKAGADLEAKISTTGATPLMLGAEQGHSEVVRVLTDAGANPNSRGLDGSTPLYHAAMNGHVGAVKVLLRAKANPLLTYSAGKSGGAHVPLDAAAKSGHLEVARALIQEHGIEGCGGASGGITAVQEAAETQQVEMMQLLTGAGVADTGVVRTSAGVADTGIALRTAVRSGQEVSVKFLLQQEREAHGQGAGYLETLDPFGATPLVCAIQACRPCSPRITRLLVDAGANSTTAVRLLDARGVVVFDGTPLALVEYFLSDKNIEGREATESQLHGLEATRRLLMRVEAVHAVSWLWASDISSTTLAVAVDDAGKAKAMSTPLASMLPILRRRARRSRVLLAALSRNSGKP